MKAEELKIGNLIFYKGEITPVTMVGLFGIQSDTKGRHINAKFSTGDLHPIPLSEEVLLKCGFEKVRSNYEEAETFDFFRGFIWFDMANQSTKLCGKYALGFVPEYLHQLQNIYYTLTGEELEVSL